jgi:hypothetical protein
MEGMNGPLQGMKGNMEELIRKYKIPLYNNININISIIFIVFCFCF